MDIKRTAKSLSDKQQASRRTGETNFTAGYGATLAIQNNLKDADRKKVMQIAKRVVKDPQVVQWLGERVYKMLLEDIRDRRERTLNYRGRF